VDHEHDLIEPYLAAEVLDRVDVAFVGPGQIRWRVPEAGEVRRQRSAAP
jgi:hypothetical protein